METKIDKWQVNKFLIYIIILIPLFWAEIIGKLLWVSFFELFNNEWFKVHIFNIIMWLISIFLLKKKLIFDKKNEKITYILLGSLFIGCISSLSISNSIFPLYWEKSHNLILFSNLILFWLIIWTILNKNDLIKLKKIIFLSIFLIAIIWIIKLIFNFWLWERLTSTFNHHNFVAPLLIIWLFLSFEKIFSKKINTILWLIIFFALLLTKSYLWIFIWTILIWYKILNKKSFLVFFSLTLFTWLSVLISNIWKLNSLISRFFIWENSIIIQFQNTKDLIFWMWFENLYDKMHLFKLPELYFYENYWFVADRSHNLIIDLLNYWGIIWLILIILLVYFLVKKLTKKGVFWVIFVWFFMFFNFPTISFFIFLIPLLISNIKRVSINSSKVFLLKFIAISGLFLSVLSIYSTFLIYNWELKEAKKVYPLNPEINYKLWENSNFEGQTIKYFSYKINKSEDKYELCESFIKKYPIAEIFAYCWDILYENNYKNKAIYYYKKTIELLPEIENYSNNEKLIKSVNHRLFSERYWIAEIKKRIEKY